MKERLQSYIAGMQGQLESAKEQVAMLKGAIQFAQQLIEDLENEGEAENLPPESAEREPE